ncbi:unnamed protein product, partial [Iphiclides podalirius]
MLAGLPPRGEVAHGGPCLDTLPAINGPHPCGFAKLPVFSPSRLVNWHISQGVSVVVVYFLPPHTVNR